MGCIRMPGLGTGGPMVFTVHAGSLLRLPRQLGRAKHQQREGRGKGPASQLGPQRVDAPTTRRSSYEPSAAQRGRMHGLLIFRAIWF
jgi:hypothetical protein